MDGMTIFGLVCLVLALVGLSLSILFLVFDLRWKHRKLKPLETTIDWNTHGAHLSPSDTPRG